MRLSRITLSGLAHDLLETAAFGAALVVLGGFLLFVL